MKTIRLTTAAVLTATIFAGGFIASASETRSVETDGSIQFRPFDPEEDDDGEPIVVVPPENNPDVDIEPEVPGTTGPLSIAKAAHMNFGTQIISNQDQTYAMVAEMAKLTNPSANGPEEVPYVSFAQVQDARGSNQGWNLSVSLTPFTSGTQNGTLTGAEISLVSSRIQYEGNTPTNAPTGHTPNTKLIPGSGAVPIMTAESGKGAGISSIVWGNQAALNQQFNHENFDPETDVVTNDAIQLFVPGTTAKDAATYRSTLNWTLTTTPANDPDDDDNDDNDNDDNEPDSESQE